MPFLELPYCSPFGNMTHEGVGKAGSEADGLRDSLTIGKESDWSIEILEEERKVRISSHKIIVCYL